MGECWSSPNHIQGWGHVTSPLRLRRSSEGFCPSASLPTFFSFFSFVRWRQRTGLCRHYLIASLLVCNPVLPVWRVLEIGTILCLFDIVLLNLAPNCSSTEGSVSICCRFRLHLIHSGFVHFMQFIQFIHLPVPLLSAFTIPGQILRKY